MKKRIKDIATVQIGYHFTRKIIPDPEGSFQVIQMKDIDDRNQLDITGIIRIGPDKDVSRYLIKKGDVLFVSRGSNNCAVTIDKDLNNTIPVSSFYIVRLKSDALLSAYLAWYINQLTAQRYLEKNLKGSYISMIGKDDFQNLLIEIPPRSLQEAVIELDALQKREKLLLHKIAYKREHLIQAISMKAIKGQLRAR